MADYSNIPELAAQQAGIERRRKIAEMIQAQSMKPLESQQIPGGYVVPTSPLLGIGKVLEAYLGKQASKEADTAQLELGQKAQGLESAERQKVAEALMPTPAIPQPSAEMGGGPGRPMMEKTPEEKRLAIIEAVTNSRFPSTQKYGELQQKFIEADVAREDTQKAREDAAKIAAAQAKEKLESDAADRAARLAETTRSNKENEEIKRMLAGDKLQSDKEKEDAKKTVKEESKRGFSDSLDVLEAKYKELDELGGIVNPEKSGLSNIGARISSSAVGQALGGTIGTDEQSIRNEIQGTIPLLILDIKNMTGASAQQMNSNIELQNFLRSASSPTSDVRANLKLLKNLRKKYLGEGAENFQKPSDEPKEENWVRDANGKLVRQ